MAGKESLYRLLGIMSGSSMDGVDLAVCKFRVTSAPFQIREWEIEQVATVPFSTYWINQLNQLRTASSEVLLESHYAFGSYLGEIARSFLEKSALSVDYIASHGHTLFHHPPEYTFQLGHGATLSKQVNGPVIVDFRSSDLANGGQGAPLAPIVESMLFPGYQGYLNLGGIANLSIVRDKKYIAFDVVACNQLLNKLSTEAGNPFDKNGEMASSGSLNLSLLEKLSSWSYLDKPAPKSLDNAYVENTLFPLLNQTDIPLADQLHTVVEWISKCLAGAYTSYKSDDSFHSSGSGILVSGGGAWNTFLIEKIAEKLESSANCRLIIPDAKVVDYKEALLLALCGLLRIFFQENTYPSWTGAEKATVGGAIYWNNS